MGWAPMRAKRKILAGLASLTLFDVASAVAADMPPPVKAPVLKAPVAPLYDWSGLYIGAHAGYRWADARFASPAYTFVIPIVGATAFPARNDAFHLNSGIVGPHAGFNVMLSPAILAGVEGDWSWGAGKSRAAATFVIFDGTA